VRVCKIVARLWLEHRIWKILRKGIIRMCAVRREAAVHAGQGTLCRRWWMMALGWRGGENWRSASVTGKGVDKRVVNAMDAVHWTLDGSGAGRRYACS
jgi:hypothetical protein